MCPDVDSNIALVCPDVDGNIAFVCPDLAGNVSLLCPEVDGNIVALVCPDVDGTDSTDVVIESAMGITSYLSPDESCSNNSGRGLPVTLLDVL